jgi:hypothetical protein
VFHSNTQRLIDYWRSLQTDAGAPARADFDPQAIAGVLTQAFMLGRGSEGLPFRLAGGFLVDLHARGLRGDSFLSLWRSECRAAVRDAASQAARAGEPVVLFAEAATADDARVGLEILLAPLTGPSGAVDRLVGFYQPKTTLSHLRGEPLVEIGHRLTVYAGQGDAPAAARLRLAAVDGLRIA